MSVKRKTLKRVGLRRQPRQARSKETFEHILRVAAELLDEVGWDGFNTNLLSQRADVGLQALYRYFPNKESVVSTLAQRIVAEWNTWFEDLGEYAWEDDPVEELADLWADHIDRYVAGVRALPGALGVRRAMAASSVLHDLDQADNEQLAAELARRLTEWKPGLAKARARTAARLLIETSVAGIDRSLAENGPARARTLRELKTMHRLYLRDLLE